MYICREIEIFYSRSPLTSWLLVNCLSIALVAENISFLNGTSQVLMNTVFAVFHGRMTLNLCLQRFVSVLF